MRRRKFASPSFGFRHDGALGGPSSVDGYLARHILTVTRLTVKINERYSFPVHGPRPPPRSRRPPPALQDPGHPVDPVAATKFCSAAASKHISITTEDPK